MTLQFDDGDDASRGEGNREPPLPTSLVPRWLAWLVLIALLASAGFSIYSLLSGAF